MLGDAIARAISRRPLPCTNGGRLSPDAPAARARRAAGEELLRLLDEHLAERSFVVDAGYSIADISLHAYLHVAGDGGFVLPPGVRSGIERVASPPRFMTDLEPYPENARPGASRSIYDLH